MKAPSGLQDELVHTHFYLAAFLFAKDFFLLLNDKNSAKFATGKGGLN